MSVASEATGSVAEPGETTGQAISRVDAMLNAARERLVRLSAAEIPAALARGAILVDIRPAAQRAIEGEFPGALVVERNVLEWRCDPTSDARLPQATGVDVEWVVLCSQGYTSSLAAAALQDLGLYRATDVIGGYRALVDEGLLGGTAASVLLRAGAWV
ncbi:MULTISPECIES: rhodanese-like domain-containing protein [unclassified Mycobacterium]|uniref:rhodanese-like domain-containing protein n=1 Tax=unclassified Mycobacterium TaxID=2642494 RepID=UPI0005651765|nr:MULTISPECIES: rhodanese-like domain-containing protein [unclassified Mycobacterium]SEA92978.1 Rhodanese-related sulfurtransferase [Mycobacterium sp. 283mftsu]